MEPAHPPTSKDTTSVWMLLAFVLVAVTSYVNAHQELRPNVAILDCRCDYLPTLEALDVNVLNGANGLEQIKFL
jgi:hypothetical protein